MPHANGFAHSFKHKSECLNGGGGRHSGGGGNGVDGMITTIADFCIINTIMLGKLDFTLLYVSVRNNNRRSIETPQYYYFGFAFHPINSFESIRNNIHITQTP